MKRSVPPALEHLREALRDLEARDLLRRRPPPVEDVSLTFCSNDYLGLARRPAPPRPSGAGASRLIVGERQEHGDLERATAQWLGVEAALAFSSGYAANVGAVSALAVPGDLVVSDALNHASIIDGCRLSRARVAVIPHLDVGAASAALRNRTEARAWVVTESYFSMDADSPDLGALRRVCDEAGAALIVDEAHALGIFGRSGRGLCEAAGVVPDALIGTLGKGLGAAGAFVAGSTVLIDWLWNRARSFVFSTGLSPVVAAAAAKNITEVAHDDEARARLAANAVALRDGLGRLGLAPLGHGPVVPIVVGDPARAVRAAAELRARGVHVQAVRPPTVPARSARLRLTVTASHSPRHIAQALGAIEECLPWLAPSS